MLASWASSINSVSFSFVVGLVESFVVSVPVAGQRQIKSSKLNQTILAQLFSEALARGRCQLDRSRQGCMFTVVRKNGRPLFKEDIISGSDWGRPPGRVCCLSNSCLLMQNWSMRRFLRPRPSVALTPAAKRLFLKICRVLHPNSSLPAAAGSAPARQVGSLQVSLLQGPCGH